MSTQVRPSPGSAMPAQWLSGSFRERWGAGAAVAAAGLVAVETPWWLSQENLPGFAASWPALPLVVLWAGLYPGRGTHFGERLRGRAPGAVLLLAGLAVAHYLVEAGAWPGGVWWGIASMLLLPPLAALMGRLAWRPHPAPHVSFAAAATPELKTPRPFVQVKVQPGLRGPRGPQTQGPPPRPGAVRLKRVLDICLSAPLLLLSAPLIGVLALCIKRVSPGPAFYSQVRGGYRGEAIRVWKLRTMWVDAEDRLAEALAGEANRREEWARSFKLRSDPRVLPGLGRLLRRTSLDELPQFWNVLKGDMSMVGPRPFPYYHLEQFESGFVRLREQVRPGITGLWQVTVRGDSDLKLQQSLDTHYIDNWSIGMDLRILARTVRAVLKGNGAY